jgi:hypothetical protein
MSQALRNARARALLGSPRDRAFFGADDPLAAPVVPNALPADPLAAPAAPADPLAAPADPPNLGVAPAAPHMPAAPATLPPLPPLLSSLTAPAAPAPAPAPAPAVAGPSTGKLALFGLGGVVVGAIAMRLLGGRA